MKTVIAPSVLTCDFATLYESVAVIEKHADMLHLDVMDNAFVPALTFGPKMVEDVAKKTSLPIDSHLMIVNPDEHVHDYIDAGSSSITFHIEAANDPVGTARKIRKRKIKAGLAINPDTSIGDAFEILSEFDVIMLMSVHPGAGGQKFIEHVLEKIERVREYISRQELDIRVQVDGGVKLENIERISKAGADIFVAGSAVFSDDDPAACVENLRNKAQRAHEKK